MGMIETAANAIVKPVRLQLRRLKGFNLQELSQRTNGLPAINCARPGPLGNPFKVSEGILAMDAREAVALFRRALLEGWLINTRAMPVTVEFVRARLRGRNGACFCKLDAPYCHADVLIEVANS